jgi:penicillin-binding protein 2
MKKKRVTLTNPKQETRRFSQRIWLLGISIVTAMLILAVRLSYLQIYQHERYTTLAQKNQLAIASITPSRGLIYDRNGVLLAENIPVTSLELIPDKIEDMDQTIKDLKKIIDIDEDELEQFDKLLDQRRSFDSIPIKVKLSEEEEAAFYINQYRFPGVAVQAHLIRHYLFGEALSPVLGYVGRINQQELAQVAPSNYSPTDYVGKVGIEKYYESILHGTAGNEQVEIDASGRAVRTLKRVPAVAGQNLYLTIDSKLQQVAINALGENRGAIVAIQPSTGQVLALVSNPSYDSNLFVKGISTKDFNQLRESPSQPLYNRAIRGQYPPGSTVKPFIALQGLATGTVAPEDKIFDPGWFKLPNSSHLYRDMKKTGHGWVNVRDSIIQSCDTYFYNLAHEMGIKEIDTILAKFGFGSKTGIDMGEEFGGILPSPGWKKRYRGVSWYPGDTVITGIGQGFMLATPLQLAQAMATLAMQGKGYKPYLLWKSKPINADAIEHPSISQPPIELPAKIWQLVLQSMVDVIEAPQGTGRIRFGTNAGYTVGAKTGTAQVFSIKQGERVASQDSLPERLRDHSVFIAFAPADEPKIALAVLVENSALAPAVARKVLDYYLLNKDETNPTITEQKTA